MKLALKFAEASRDMVALNESENIRADIKLLRNETTHSNKSSISGVSNFEEAIGGTVTDVWTDEGEGEDNSNI